MLLLITSFLLIFFLFYSRAQFDWRSSVVAALVILGALISIITEILNFKSNIDETHLFFSWALVVIILIFSLPRHFNSLNQIEQYSIRL